MLIYRTFRSDMTARHIPKTIREEGLELFLKRTKKQHNELDYTDFTNMMRYKVTPNEMAHNFGITRNPMLNWIKVYKAERDDQEVEELRP